MDFSRVYFRRLRSLAAIVTLSMCLFVACDVLEDDVSPDNPTVEFTGNVVYTMTGNSAFIDLRGMVKSTEAVQLTITAQPRSGRLTDLHKGLLKYTPFSNFKSGRDGFQFSIYSADNKLLLHDTVVIMVESDTANLPCGIYPVNDSVSAPMTEPITVPVLYNDVLCPDSGNVKLEIYHPGAGTPPFQGTATVVGNQFIVYTPNAGFEGSDSVIYKVSSRLDTTKVGYGILVVSKRAVTTPPSSCDWTLMDDVFTIYRSAGQDTVFLPIFQNDTLCPSLLSRYKVSIVQAPRHGVIQLNGLNPPRYGITLPDSTFAPMVDTLVYRLCADTVCRQATTVIKINP
jgi:hypothetical protein